MKHTLSTYEIADSLYRDEYASWSYEGAQAMAEYLEQLEEDIGEEFEMDIVAIRCEFSEYSFRDIQDNYDYIEELKDASDLDEMIEVLSEYTSVIPVNDKSVIIADF